MADAIVSERLAACANIYPPISSLYHWKGKIESTREVPLLLKTRQSLFDMLVERVTVLHPYETPSIVGIEVIQASAAYRAWLVDSTDQ
ncbi:MAG: divalent-cation tolerance protein CutA [Alphaproteobacteria bacterium]|nr:divalent-cation tolerance protein CutA [Alphaproteobacteria bacterium]